MDILHPSAVIGTNSWGSAAYGVMLRGSYVEDDTIREAMRTAEEYDLKIYDLARDYGLGKAQKMIGEFGTQDLWISAEEMRQLELAADKAHTKIMKPDLFRMFVKKSKA